MNKGHTLAIIGLGPRGIYALECFLRRFAGEGIGGALRLRLFEASRHLGAGPVWAVDQPHSNWSNVIERLVTLPRRDAFSVAGVRIPAFPSFHDWAGADYDARPASRPDIFPKRSEIGGYLAARARSLVEPLIGGGIATLVRGAVTDISTQGDQLHVQTDDGAAMRADQVLLTVGHQPTELDEQLEGWRRAAEGEPSLSLHVSPYPVEAIMSDTAAQADLRIAARGFGLATIDIVRALAERHGDFEGDSEAGGALNYVQTSDADLRIAPFSLDGLPLAPKPLTPELDARFAPSETDLADLRSALGDPDAQRAARDETFLVDAMAPLIAKVYLSLSDRVAGGAEDAEGAADFAQLIRRWLQDQRLRHALIADTEKPAADLMTHLADMATGAAPVTLDYCLGQVWRQCYPAIYPALSHSALSDAAFAKIIALDESVKRYTFGPPVASTRQMIALEQSGHLVLDVLNDPDIDLGDNGWSLTKGADHFDAPIMVNTVLDPPNLSEVNSALIANLLQDGLLREVHDDLGVETDRDGFVDAAKTEDVPIAVLGRLVKGSVMGVDDIVECFGDRAERWARAGVARLM